MLSNRQIRKLGYGTPEYVLAHGNKQRAKGKNYSVSFKKPLYKNVVFRNPNEAYKEANKAKEHDEALNKKIRMQHHADNFWASLGIYPEVSRPGPS